MSLSMPFVSEMLATIASVHSRTPTTPRAADVWASALGDCGEAEVSDAMLVLLRDVPTPPTPADVLRVVRDSRAAVAPQEKLDPRASIPLVDGVREILASLEAKMRLKGMIVRRASQK